MVLAVHTSWLSALSFETEALINPKALSKLVGLTSHAFKTQAGRSPTSLPCACLGAAEALFAQTLLPSAPSVPQTFPTYVQIVQILLQAALTHHRLAPMRHKGVRPAKTVICPGKASFPSALPEAAESPESVQEGLPT